MEIEKAIKKKMLSLRLEEKYPPSFFANLREDFRQMYTVGWEQGRLEINQHTCKKIAQYDKNGKLIAIFKSRIEAAKHTGFSEAGIKRSMERGRPMKQGWTWKYVKEEITEYPGPA